MRMIIQKYESQKVGRDLLIHWNKILKQERKYPLDFIAQKISDPTNADSAKEKRRNSIKNVIMRIVVEIRERKEKPKLSDLIAASKQQQQFKDIKQWKDKVIQLYTDNPQQANSKKDENFNRLMESFNRVHQSLSSQQDSLSNLIKQVNGLIDRRDQNEEKLRSHGAKNIKPQDVPKRRMSNNMG